MVAAYRDPKAGRDRMQTPITSLFSGVLTVLIGPRLGRTLDKRAADLPAHFDRPVPATDRSRRSTTPSNSSAAAPWGSANITHTSARCPRAHGQSRREVLAIVGSARRHDAGEAKVRPTSVSDAQWWS